MNLFIIVSLFCLVVSVSLIAIIVVRNPRGDVNRIFVFFCVMIAYMSFTELGYRLADTPETAASWMRAEAFWPVALSALVHFSLAFTGHRLTGNKYFLVLLYAPAFVFSFLDLFTHIFVVVDVKEYWGWLYVTKPSLVRTIGAVWIFCMTLSPPVLTWRYYSRSEGTRKQQAKYVSLGFTIAALTALSTGYLFLMLNTPFPSLTITAFVIGEVFVTYAIWKYELFALTPAMVAEQTIATMSDYMFIVSPENTIISINDSAFGMLGYKADEIAGKEFGAVLMSGKDTANSNSLPADFPAGITLKDFEMVLVTKAGTQVPVSVSASVVKGKDGRIRGFVCIARDISERKQAQENLQSLYESERALRQNLEKEIKKRSDFARILVHELKTPLTAIIASSELLVDEPKRELWTRIADNIRRSAFNLNRRITELLDISQGEAGMLQLKPAITEPQEMFQQVIESMTPVISSHKQSLVLEIPVSLPKIYVDKDRLQQVLLNLIDNAIKYNSEGGTITLRAVREEDFLMVSVQDTGHGIPRAEQAHLFNPYTRLESVERKVGGMGLGLAICKILVELHGGHIWVESDGDKGSTFSFRIPLNSGKAI